MLACAAVALRLRELLGGLGLRAQTLESESPDRVVSRMACAERVGRYGDLFADVLAVEQELPQIARG